MDVIRECFLFNCDEWNFYKGVGLMGVGGVNCMEIFLESVWKFENY